MHNQAAQSHGLVSDIRMQIVQNGIQGYFAMFISVLVFAFFPLLILSDVRFLFLFLRESGENRGKIMVEF